MSENETSTEAAAEPDPLHRAYYQRFYLYGKQSPLMQKIWSEAMADALVPRLDQYSYVTRAELIQMGEGLDVPEGGQVLDIGCGRGGPGLWLASQYAWRLHGVDLVPEAVAQAQAFQSEFELAYPAQFQEGHFLELPQADASMDGAMSVDALWTASDKVLALAEVARVLKPGAHFVFTHWDYTTIDPVPAFERSGLKLLSRTDSPGWKAHQDRIYAAILSAEEALRAEMGDAAEILINEARTVPTYLEYSVRRVYRMVKV